VRKHESRKVPDHASYQQNVGFLYQIRAKRVGRQRLFTKQAWIKNRVVLLAMKATVVGIACGVVMLVFNFFLIGLCETSDKWHPVLF
jgi:hypothetical protein